MKPYTLYLVTLVLILAGALNWGLVGAFDLNPVNMLANAMGYPVIETLVYIVIGVAAIIHIFRRDYYLPFLGPSVFPCGPLAPKTPTGANVAVEITTEPNSNVIFWAAEPSTDGKVRSNPWIAYDMYTNSGVVRSDDTGKAVLRVRNPAPYQVPFKGKLAPHIHYRTCTQHGMLSPVQTVEI